MIFVLLSLNRPETLWVGIAACCLYVTCLLTSSKLYRSINGNLELAYDLERAIENAEMIANTDMLTGLKNRRAFFDEAVPVFAQAKQHQQMTSVMVMDVDHFKRINDAHGHAVGDVALQHVSHLLTQKLRRSDICCRFGGEEFAVLLADTNAEGAKLTAEKLRTLIMSTPCVIEDKLSISLTASFGVSDKGETLDEMLNLADQAMYQAKNSGRNLVGVYVVPDVQTNSKMTRKKRNERTKKHTSVPAESSETSLPTEISSPPTKH
jgi:diguanylate cyclase (GGDEF)-like protein